MIDEKIARASTPMFPYGDGSGFEITVGAETHEDGLRVFVRHLNDTVYVSAERWPQVRNEIDRIVAFMRNVNVSATDMLSEDDARK